ncbi:MAG TPA: LysE family transporter [Acidimicrobiia bacterium]|nr:LysE family transporter [Acidimicrobiia bacterium]
MDAFTTGVVAGYGIAIPVGAIAILIIEVGIRRGFRAAFFAGAGAATADLLYAALAAVGGAALAGAIESIGEPLRVVSGVVLALIAVFGIVRAVQPAEPTPTDYPRNGDLARTYGRFLGLTIINPTTVIYFAAVIIGLGVAEGMTPGDGAVFVAGAFLASLSWQTLLAVAAALAGRRLRPEWRAAVSVLGNLVILGFAIFVLFG